MNQENKNPENIKQLAKKEYWVYWAITIFVWLLALLVIIFVPGSDKF